MKRAAGYITKCPTRGVRCRDEHEKASIMTRNTVCSECGGTMQRGFVVETAGRFYAYDAADWPEGKPEKSVWTVSKLKINRLSTSLLTAVKAVDF